MVDIHPKIAEIQSYGVCSEELVYHTFQVYLDLCEVRNWWNVTTHLCKDLGSVFLSGHPTRTEPREIVLPLKASTQLSPSDLHNYLKILKLEKRITKNITLALYDTDMTIVYFKISGGLISPTAPEDDDIHLHPSFMRRCELSRSETKHYLGLFHEKQNFLRNCNTVESSHFSEAEAREDC